MCLPSNEADNLAHDTSIIRNEDPSRNYILGIKSTRDLNDAVVVGSRPLDYS